MLELTTENFATCNEKSKCNDAEAICDLARFYYYGKCVEKDLNYAFKLWTTSAGLGNARAMYNLAWCFEHGDGVYQDNSKALEYYNKSANMGYNRAFAALGNCYYYGYLGVDINKKLSYSFYRKGAELCDSTCQYSVGWFYSNGEIVEKNPIEAIKWYKKSADNGNIDSMVALGNCLYYGIGTDADPYSAFEYYQSAADKGDSIAQFSVGWFYDNGEVVPLNRSEALKWFVKATEQNYEDAVNAVNVHAEWYYYGQNGYEQNIRKALELYELSAKHGNVNSMLMAGYIYDFGEGVQPDPQKAVYWYKKATENGDNNACLNLANMYLQGRGVPENLTEGIIWLKKAAEMGNAMAESSLGRQHTNGDGVERSLSKAEYWILKAEKDGYINCDTMLNLALMYEEVHRYTDAFVCIKKALASDESSISAHYLYGFYLYLGKGTNVSYYEARQHLQWVIARNPNYLNASKALADINRRIR